MPGGPVGPSKANAEVRGLIGLLLLTALAVTAIGSPVVDFVILPLLATLIAAHLDREAGELAVGLVGLAARLLPAHRREEHLDEWIDHILCAGECGVAPLTRAFSIALIAAPALGVGLRVGRARRKVG